MRRTLIWNFKGGVGKTTLALQIAMLEGAFVVANEPHSSTPNILGKDRAKALEHGEELPNVPKDIPLIYDFGGFAEERVVAAAKDADYVVIPVAVQKLSSVLEIQGTINAIQSIKPHNSNIIIVNNMSGKGHLDYIAAAFASVDINMDIIPIKDSSGFTRSIETQMSLIELIESNPLYKYHYSKPLEQIQNLINRISQDPGA